MTAALAPPTEPAAPARQRPRGHALPRLRELRRAAALSQAELAGRAGVGRVTIARLELGQQLAYPSTVRALAAALRVRPGILTAPAAEKEGDD